MDINKLEKIIAVLKENGVTEFELSEEDGTHIRLCRSSNVRLQDPSYSFHNSPQLEPAIRGQIAEVSPAGHSGAAPEAMPAEKSNLVKVESPIVGTFYRKPSPDASPFVEVGSRVKKGETLCIIEAMKLMNEIESPRDGVVEKVFLQDGQVVEFGEILFLINPE